MDDTETTRRFAASGDGLIHEIIDFRPHSGVYIARCGRRIAAGHASVWRSADPPGVVCSACARAVPDSGTVS